MSTKRKAVAGFEEMPQAVFHASDAFQEAPGFSLANRLKLTLGPGGRVVIPAALRQAMEVAEGDTILAWVEDGELHLLSPKVGGRRAQKLFTARASGAGLVDELLLDRRAEAGRDD